MPNAFFLLLLFLLSRLYMNLTKRTRLPAEAAEWDGMQTVEHLQKHISPLGSLCPTAFLPNKLIVLLLVVRNRLACTRFQIPAFQHEHRNVVDLRRMALRGMLGVYWTYPVVALRNLRSAETMEAFAAELGRWHPKTIAEDIMRVEVSEAGRAGLTAYGRSVDKQSRRVSGHGVGVECKQLQGDFRRIDGDVEALKV